MVPTWHWVFSVKPTSWGYAHPLPRTKRQQRTGQEACKSAHNTRSMQASTECNNLADTHLFFRADEASRPRLRWVAL